MKQIAFVLDSIDDLSDDLKELYIEKDGKFVANVIGAKNPEDYKNLVETLKTTKAEKEELANRLSSFGDDTPETLLELKEQLAVAKAASKSADPAEIQTKAEELAAIKTRKLAKQLEDATSTNKTLDMQVKELNTKIEDHDLLAEIVKVAGPKVAPTAIDDVFLKAKVGGVRFNPDVNEFIQKDTGLNIEEWVDSTLEKSPHLRPPSVSGGARGGGGGGADGKAKSYMGLVKNHKKG